jgi:hypothetical protein
MGRGGKSEGNYLDRVPARAVGHEEGAEGRLVLLRPKFMTGPLARLLQPRIPKQHFRVRLDDIGTAVWKLIDGERNVGQIADALVEPLGDRIEPRYERVSRFIHSLHKGSMITLAAPGENAEG